MVTLQWKEIPVKSAVLSPAYASPWFAVSLGLLGMIIGVWLALSDVQAQAAVFPFPTAGEAVPARPPTGGCGCGGGAGCGKAAVQ